MTTIPPQRHHAAALSPSEGGLPRPARWLFAGLLVYFVLQLAVRVGSSSAVELDEAEQLLWTQDLRLGYGPQPPLYTWLQWLVFQVFGVSVFSLALLKNTLLFGTFGFTWLAARRLLPPTLAALSSVSLLLLLQIVWESQRDLTHSVLVTTAAAATLWLLVELWRRPRASLYLALGVAVAAGLQAKYSYAMFVAAFGTALLLTPGTRHVLLDRRLLLSIAVAVTLTAPHAWWVLQHLDTAVSSTSGKLSGESTRGLAQIARGLGSIALILPSFLSPLWLVLAVLFGRGLASHATGRDPVLAGLFARYLGVLVGLLVAIVVFGGAAHFRDRWLQPLLFFAPLMFFCGWPGLQRHPRLRWLPVAAAAMALTALVLLALRPWSNGQRGRPDELNLPIAAIAQAVRAAGVEPRVVVSDNKHLAGSLRLVFPAARVLHSGTDALPTAGPPVLLITYLPTFEALRARLPASQAASPVAVTAPYVHASIGTPPVRLAFVVSSPVQRP